MKLLPDFVAAGILKKDSIWKDEIWLAGDVVIPEGVTLRILPGAVIRCVQSAEKKFQVAGLQQGRWGLSHSKSLNHIFVLGQLLAEGEADRPIRFGMDTAWAGIHFKNKAQGRFRQAVLSGSASEAIAAWDSAIVEADQTVFTGNWASFGVYDRGEGSLRQCEMRDNVRGGAFCNLDASLKVEGSKINDGADGVIADGGRISIKDTILLNQGVCGISLSGQTKVALEQVKLSGALQGLHVESGVLSISGCKLLDHKDTGIWLGSEGRVEMAGCSVERGRIGLSMEGGLLSMRDCIFSNQGQAAVLATGNSVAVWKDCSIRSNPMGSGLFIGTDARVEMSGCRIEGGKVGASTEGGILQMRDCFLESQLQCGIDLRGFGHLIESSHVNGEGTGLFLSRGGAILTGFHSECGLEGVVIAEDSIIEWDRGGAKGGVRGIRIKSGRVKARALQFDGQSQTAVSVTGDSITEWHECSIRSTAAGTGVWIGPEGRVEMSGCRIEGGNVGVATEGGLLRLRDCLLENQLQCGIDLRGSGHWIEDSSVRGKGTGLFLSQGAAVLAGFESEYGREGVLITESSSLEWNGGGAKGGMQGVRIKSGSLNARGLKFDDQRQAAALVTGDSVTIWNRCSMSNTPIGIAASSSRCYLRDCRFGNCRYPLSAEPDAEILESSAIFDWRWAWRFTLLDFVLNTRLKPFWRAIYHFIYQTAAWRMRATARRDSRIEAAWVDRGWAGGDWEPGISDLDFVLSVKGLEGEEGGRWIKQFWKRYDRSRILFPFKGEALIAEPAEHAAYAQQGSIRAMQMPRQAVLLMGKLPHSHGPQIIDKPFNVLWEVSHSYTQFMVWWIYRPQFPWETRRRHIFKSVLDFLRYSEHSESGIFRSRREVWENIERSPWAEWKQRLQPLLSADAPDVVRCDRILAELCLACLPILDSMARKALSRVPVSHADVPSRWIFAKPYRGEDAGALTQSRLKFLERSQRWLEGSLSGAFLNDLYCSYLVLEESSLNASLDAGNLACWAQLWRTDPAARNAPLLMTRDIWRCWQRLGYQENPLRFLELGVPGSGKHELFSAGEFLPGNYAFRWGLECDIPIGIDGLLKDQARASLASFRLQWRLMGSNTAAVSTGYMLHYLYSRVLGLRLLLERGVPTPFFTMDQVLAYYRDEFPETYKEVNRLVRGIAGKNKKTAFLEHYYFLDSQLRAIKEPAGDLIKCIST